MHWADRVVPHGIFLSLSLRSLPDELCRDMNIAIPSGMKIRNAHD